MAKSWIQKAMGKEVVHPKQSSSWFDWGSRTKVRKRKSVSKRYYYGVERKFKGGVRTMLKTSSYKKAAAFYHAHPQAKYIQKYTKHGVTAGRLQPRTPNKIRFRGKTYKRAYVGPHDKRFANSAAKSFRKSGFPTQIRKMKKGWFIFVKS